MAERGSDTTGKKLLSFVTKRSKRVQEKVMQKMGRSEQTKDEVYTEFVVNFNKQQLAASRLNKELDRHMKALKVLGQSSKALLDLWSELYDPEWKGHNEFQEILQQKMLLWSDVFDSSGAQVGEAMQNYLAKFPETKKRVEKRERKVVDYDAARREMESTRQKQNVNPAKIQQSEDNFHRAKQAFDEVADELYEELPALYDSRIQFYATLFQSMANIEAKFHDEMSKVDTRFGEVMGELLSQAETGAHSTRKERNLETSTALLTPVKSPVDDEEEVSINQSEGGEDTAAFSESYVSAQDTSTPATPTRSTTEEKSAPATPPPEKPAAPSKPPKPSRSSTNKSPEPTSPTVAAPEDEVFDEERDKSDDQDDQASANGDAIPDDTSHHEEKQVNDEEQPAEQDKSSDSAPSLNILYKVIATHNYIGEDEDELSFDKGTIILVVPYDDPEDDEDGWKTGVIEETGQKGLFPENFSKKL